MDEWAVIYDFPHYSVSPKGLVRNDKTGRVLRLSTNQRGIVQAGFYTTTTHKRAVDLLVAHAFLEPPPADHFDSVIHLDGDLSNCAADNLMWRPRWFRITYHKQFIEERRRVIVPVYLVDTDEIFPSSLEAAQKYGLLEKDIMMSTVNNTTVWPTGYEFRVLKD